MEHCNCVCESRSTIRDHSHYRQASYTCRFRPFRNSKHRVCADGKHDRSGPDPGNCARARSRSRDHRVDGIAFVLLRGGSSPNWDLGRSVCSARLRCGRRRDAERPPATDFPRNLHFGYRGPCPGNNATRIAFSRARPSPFGGACVRDGSDDTCARYVGRGPEEFLAMDASLMWRLYQRDAGGGSATDGQSRGAGLISFVLVWSACRCRWSGCWMLSGPRCR